MKPSITDRLMGHTGESRAFGFGVTKAIEMVDKGMTDKDLDEWLKFEEEQGTRATMFWMQRVKNPSQVPRAKSPKEPEPGYMKPAQEGAPEPLDDEVKHKIVQDYLRRIGRRK